MKKARTVPRRHGVSRGQRLAILALFRENFHPRVIGRLLHLTTDDVLRALRRSL
jgi:hypothetical protein